MSNYQAPQSNYIPAIRNGKLLFRFDPQRGIVEISNRGIMEYVDLAQLIEIHQKQSATMTITSN